MPESSLLDARLAEIDRRLRTIQSELAPAEAAPVRSAPADGAREPGGDATLVAQLRRLIDAQEQLVASARELLASHAARAALPAAAPAASSADPAAGPAAPSADPVGVTAGPFAGTPALRRFEQALRALPDVREVVVREYRGDARVVLDVHLAAPIS